MSTHSRIIIGMSALTASFLFVGSSFNEVRHWPFNGLATGVLKMFDPETAHNLALKAAARGLVPVDRRMPAGVYRTPEGISEFAEPLLKDYRDRSLETQLCSLRMASPIGLAAGFDKDCVAPFNLARVGFGAVEVGTVTPEPQPGNPLPRLFRLEADRAIVNRFGFNSAGFTAVSESLRQQRQKHGEVQPTVIGVNLGINKTTTEQEAPAAYARGISTFGDLADYYVINVSSPNTPGLRDLQHSAALRKIIQSSQAARTEAGLKTPIFLKISPDLSAEQLKDICSLAMELSIDGMIVSNTTISRPEHLTSSDASEAGGLSGQPLFDRSTEMLGQVYQLTGGAIPLVGCGGVSSGMDAFEKIAHGASFVQLYSSLVLDGPRVVSRIKDDLVVILREKGFESVSEAVGSKFRAPVDAAAAATATAKLEVGSE